MYTNILSLALGLAAMPLVAGHPGEDHHKEAMKRREFLKNNVANLNHCTSKLDALGVTERSIQRRQSVIHGIREKRGLVARGQDHESRSYDAEIGQRDVFKSNASCVLAPEEILGPYCTCCYDAMPGGAYLLNTCTCRRCRRVDPIRYYREAARCACASGHFLYQCRDLPARCRLLRGRLA